LPKVDIVGLASRRVRGAFLGAAARGGGASVRRYGFVNGGDGAASGAAA
jgi:hypothetical protein